MNEAHAILNETPWEERNLGVKSFALNEKCLDILNQRVLADELSSLQQRFRQFFVFARLPNSHLHLVPCLQGHGFYLVEGTVCPVIQFNRSTLMQTFSIKASQFIPGRFRNSSIQFVTLDNANERPDKILLSIARDSFSSDRFHMDFQCPEKVANHRFELWISDLLKDRHVTFDILEINYEIAGFMARKEGHLIIAGFSRQYARSGLGDYLWLGSLQNMKEHGLRYAETLVSINNIPSLNLHARLGFKFRHPQYSFHYWQK